MNRFIYIDESILIKKNNHFKCYRKNYEEFFNYENIGKSNLLMAIDKKEIIHCQINE